MGNRDGAYLFLGEEEGKGLFGLRHELLKCILGGGEEGGWGMCFSFGSLGKSSTDFAQM